jgi:hypothetical protein
MYYYNKKATHPWFDDPASSSTESIHQPHTKKKACTQFLLFFLSPYPAGGESQKKGAILVGRRQRFRSGFLFHPPCSIGSPLAGCSGVSGDVREEQWGGDVGGAGGEGDERHAHRPRLGDEPRDLRHPQPRPWVRPISLLGVFVFTDDFTVLLVIILPGAAASFFFSLSPSLFKLC